MSASKEKTLGQVWTPQWMVNNVLDQAGYYGQRILNSLILEPSFGAGAFLKTIILRIIEQGFTAGLKKDEIGVIVDQNVHGIEFDTATYETTKKHLIDLVHTNHQIPITLPHLVNSDTLDYQPKNNFDYIVGNPPYVRIHHLPEEMRNKVKQYSTSTGTTDLYIIFYELGYSWLKETGTLAYIAPNGWLKNVSQKRMRITLIQQQAIRKIIDYGTVDVFPNIATYTCITVLNKQKVPVLTFAEMATENTQKFSVTKQYNNLLARYQGEPLRFFPTAETQFLQRFQGNTKNENALQHLAKVQNGLATLGDKYFILPPHLIPNMQNPYILDAVKASTFKGGAVATKMAFPYRYVNTKYVGLTEEEFSQETPDVYKWFLANAQKLRDRSLDRGSEWFWYGRSQAIQETNKRKLVLSPVLHPDKPYTSHILPANTLVYSGLFITETSNLTLETIQEAVNTPDFVKFASLLGKNMSGGYVNISAPILKQFIVQ